MQGRLGASVLLPTAAEHPSGGHDSASGQKKQEKARKKLVYFLDLLDTCSIIISCNGCMVWVLGLVQLRQTKTQHDGRRNFLLDLVIFCIYKACMVSVPAAQHPALVVFRKAASPVRV